jgi:hypothetical protein
MRISVGRSSRRLLASFVAGVVIASGPQIAMAAYDAVNSDKVDGFHAVGAGATMQGRTGKLVATNGSGVLPNNIIAKAPDAGRLDGADSAAFQRRVSEACAPTAMIRAIGADGSATCAPDDIDGGNAQTLDGKDSSEFQAVINHSCASEEMVSAIDIQAGVVCAPDDINGGNAQTLDGIDGSQLRQPGANVVVVRGDGSATSNAQGLRDAIAGITTASASSPYLVVVGPGSYDLALNALILKPYVNVMGSGRNATFLISGATAAINSGALQLANEVEVSHLRFTHSSTAPTTAIGVASGLETRLTDVEVSTSAPTAYAINVSSGAILNITDSDISVGGNAGEAVGVLATDSALVTIRDSNITAFAQDPSVVTESAVAINGDSGTMLVENSSLKSSGKVAQKHGAGNSVLRIAGSRFDGEAPVAVTCFNNYDTFLAAATC